MTGKQGREEERGRWVVTGDSFCLLAYFGENRDFENGRKRERERRVGEEVKEEEAWKINFFPMTRLPVMWEHFLIRRKVIINHHSLSRAHVMSKDNG